MASHRVHPRVSGEDRDRAGMMGTGRTLATGQDMLKAKTRPSPAARCDCSPTCLEFGVRVGQGTR